MNYEREIYGKSRVVYVKYYFVKGGFALQLLHCGATGENFPILKYGKEMQLLRILIK